MFYVLLKNAETLCYETKVTFDTVNEAFQFASRREWCGAAVHLPNGSQAALFKRGKLCQWLVAYEKMLYKYDPTILML